MAKLFEALQQSANSFFVSCSAFCKDIQAQHSNTAILTLATTSVVVLSTSVLYLLYTNVLPRKPKVLEAGTRMFEGVKKLYDRSSAIWLQTWGEHMHSGYYPSTVSSEEISKWTKDQHLEAQHEMMLQLLNRLPKPVHLQFGVSKDNVIRVLDCGCGVGGSSRFLYKYLSEVLKNKGVKIEVIGITLSPYQKQRADELTALAGIPNGSVKFFVKNALHTEFPENYFDLVWSLESGEHMPGKKEWLTEIKRILKQNGVFLCACWCHRETSPNETLFNKDAKVHVPLSTEEKILLGRISKNYSLPRFVPPSEYKYVAAQLGLKGFEDNLTSFTVNVLPFWPAVVSSCMKPISVLRLIILLPFGGFTAVKGAVTAYLMMQGFKKGTLEFAAFSIVKQ